MGVIADISVYQGMIDWAALSPCLDFVIVRASVGGNVDPLFGRNAAACHQYGVPMHVYHYLKALDVEGAVREAGLFYKTALPWEPLSYVLDIEGNALSDGKPLELTRAFVDELRRLGAGRVGLYTGNSAYREYGFSRDMADWLWIARYGPDTGNVPNERYYLVPCDLWQYTSMGKLPGITENTVDLNILWDDRIMTWFTGGTAMAVKIGSARGDENGGAHGGQPGDQTGNEVSTQNWYKHSKGWRVFRAKNQAAREKIAYDMQAACDNPHIGYDQYDRLTLYNAAAEYGFDCAKVTTDCETDCSALVRVCCAYAGISLPNFNTSTEPDVLLKSGAFDELTGAKYTDSSDYLLRGDILDTRTQGHTVVVLSNGAKSGGPATLKRGDRGESVVQLQLALMAKGYSVGDDGADGVFGKNTETAVRLFQADNGLVVDGEVGPATWAALKEVATVAPQNPMERYWTITKIPHVSQAEYDAMKKRWPDLEAVEE